VEEESRNSESRGDTCRYQERLRGCRILRHVFVDDMYINISNVMSKSTGCNGNDHDYKPASKLMLKALCMK
jgi:hypothetical protein